MKIVCFTMEPFRLTPKKQLARFKGVLKNDKKSVVQRWFRLVNIKNILQDLLRIFLLLKKMWQKRKFPTHTKEQISVPRFLRSALQFSLCARGYFLLESVPYREKKVFFLNLFSVKDTAQLLHRRKPVLVQEGNSVL